MEGDVLSGFSPTSGIDLPIVLALLNIAIGRTIVDRTLLSRLSKPDLQSGLGVFWGLDGLSVVVELECELTVVLD